MLTVCRLLYVIYRAMMLALTQLLTWMHSFPIIVLALVLLRFRCACVTWHGLWIPCEDFESQLSPRIWLSSFIIII